MVKRVCTSPNGVIKNLGTWAIQKQYNEVDLEELCHQSYQRTKSRAKTTTWSYIFK